MVEYTGQGIGVIVITGVSLQISTIFESNALD